MKTYFVHSITTAGGEKDGTEHRVEFGTSEESELVCIAANGYKAADIVAALQLSAAVEQFVRGMILSDLNFNGPIANVVKMLG